MTKIKVMFVCLGNICRSPLAHAIMDQKVKDLGWEKLVEVDSCGTHGYHTGEDADPRTREVAAIHRVPMNHSAKQLTADHLRSYDYILAMDDSNLADIAGLSVQEAEHKVHKMRDFDDTDKGADVPDPYYGGADGFEKGFELLDRSCEGFVKMLKRELNE